MHRIPDRVPAPDQVRRQSRRAEDAIARQQYRSRDGQGVQLLWREKAVAEVEDDERLPTLGGFEVRIAIRRHRNLQRFVRLAGDRHGNIGAAPGKRPSSRTTRWRRAGNSSSLKLM